MLQIILLIAGIGAAFRRPHLRKLSELDFPDVDPVQFAQWRQAQLKATDALLWASWGCFFITLLIIFVASGMHLTSDGAIGLQILILLGFLVGVVISAVQSNKATKLKVAAGITWPPK